jgi:hypothetical protein
MLVAFVDSLGKKLEYKREEIENSLISVFRENLVLELDGFSNKIVVGLGFSLKHNIFYVFTVDYDKYIEWMKG